MTTNFLFQIQLESKQYYPSVPAGVFHVHEIHSVLQQYRIIYNSQVT